MMRTDSEIKKDVQRELAWDTRVDETDIGVQVRDGIVTLTGTVPSWAKRMAALQAAQRVAGVLDIANDVLVKVPGTGQPTDAEVASAVRHALEWDVLVPDQRIRSTVSNGWVTLDGDVDYWSEREDAERAVRNLAGVRGIANRLEIAPAKLAVNEVRQAIEEALERHAEREAKRIQLDVLDGSVVLSGVVESYGEREAIVGAAKGTRGVRRVDDRLRVAPA
jgi:osmotically-inducible protein OsmY